MTNSELKQQARADAAHLRALAEKAQAELDKRKQQSA
jgi:hypothetical protein